MNVFRRLYQMAHSVADRQGVNADYKAGVFDPAVYGDPAQVTPDQFAADMARLRFLADRTDIVAHPQIRDDLQATVLRPFLELTVQNGVDRPIEAMTASCWQALDQRLETFRPNWSEYFNEGLERAEDKFDDRVVSVKQAFLSNLGDVVAYHLVAQGALSADATPDGATPPLGGITGLDQVREKVQHARSRGEFLSAWNGALEHSTLRWSGERLAQTLSETAQGLADRGPAARSTLGPVAEARQPAASTHSPMR